MQKPPGILVQIKNKKYPFWYPCKRDQVKDVVLGHLAHWGREMPINPTLGPPNPMSSHYAISIGLKEDAGADEVYRKLMELGHVAEAAAVKNHNQGEQRVIDLDEYRILWVRRFKFVKDRTDPDVAEPDDFDVLDIKTLI